MTNLLETNRLAGIAEMEATTAQADQRVSGGGISLSGEKVFQNTAQLPEEQRLLVRWLFGHARDNAWSYDDCATHAGISKSTLHKIFTGRHTDDDGKPVRIDTICETIARIQRLTLERDGLQRGSFVETSVYRRMAKVCDEARLMQIIAFIYGDGQIGKTCALQEYERRNHSGQTLYLRIPACAGANLLARQLGEACHITRQLNFEETIRRIKKCLDHSKLLLIDEAHLLFETYQHKSVLRCLEMLREIHDVTGVGMVFCATNVFKDEMETGAFSKMLRQLRRRGIYELSLPNVPLQADLDAIAASYKLAPARGDAADLVRLIAHKHGLGRYCKFLMKAAHFAGKRKESLKWDHFIKVHELIIKLSTFETEKD